MRGYFEMKHLDTLRKFESILQGHPDMLKTPGVDMTTGSLGQGLSCGVGMALEAKMLKKEYSVFVVLGDGELNEGQIWEAAMSAAKFNLDNLVAIVDRNRLQMDGTCDEIMPMEPLDDKFKAFNWDVERIDGHDMCAVLSALEKAKASKGKPFCIIADTVKGKGVSYMEDVRVWHGKCPCCEEYETAVQEIKRGDS
jgi:transketolase